jgi:hypothetical protein
MKPSFFLAELAESRLMGKLRVDVVERELARDLFTTPAMRQGAQIFARRTSMLFFLWDRILEMRPSSKDALLYAMARHGLDVEGLRRAPQAQGPDLKRVADRELETWIHHELGEAEEDSFNGQAWQEIVAAYAATPVEIFARVIKDLLADTHAHGLLRHIIANRLDASLGFYVAFISPLMRIVFPEIFNAFQEFKETTDWSLIDQVREQGYRRAHRQAQLLTELHQLGEHHGRDWASAQIHAHLLAPLGIRGRSSEADDEGGA